MSERPTLWRYSFPNVNHEGWAVFLLDSFGMLAVTSDFGNYAFHWPRNGWGPEDFRRFLTSIESDYLIGKLSHGLPREPKPEETRKLLRELILSWRRDGSVSRELARREWNLMRDSDFDTDVGCHEWYLTTKINDAHEMLQYGPPAQLVAFSERVWPRFVAELKADLEREERHAR